MARVLLTLEDQGDEIQMQMAIDPPLTEDKTMFSTAEIFGLYFREHAGELLSKAVTWAKQADKEVAL